MSHFNWGIDGSIVGLYLVITMVAGIAVRKYVGKVEQFLIAGREMNLYLGIASLAATEFGIVTCMYTAQNGFEKGFSGAIPGILNAIAMFAVGYTGFCVKKLRDAGVMTIPELFQKRFGSRIRWLAGVVIVLGGLLNMGVFLQVGGQFLINATGLGNETVQVETLVPQDGSQPRLQTAISTEQAVATADNLSWVKAHRLELIMTALLLAVMIYTILGGMLSVLVTDYLQFVVMSVGLIAVTLLILFKIGWTPLVGAVETHHHAGGFNPFANESMGWPYVMFNCFLNFAVVLTWQTTIQRLLAAKDTKTGRQVYTRTAFFFVCRFIIPGLWGMAALAILAPTAVDADKHTFMVNGHTYDTLLAMPLLLGAIVPVGLMGILVAAMLAADMSTDSSYMLTWGSVIYNDILAPFRKTQWSEKRGLLWSRMIVALIGVFLLVFGLWYHPKIDLWTYLGVTGTIYLASMATLLIACCYWKRANDWGAVGAIIVGAVIPVTYLVIERLPSTAKFAHDDIGPYYSGMSAYLLAGAAMIIGSFLKIAFKGEGARA